MKFDTFMALQGFPYACYIQYHIHGDIKTPSLKKVVDILEKLT